MKRRKIKLVKWNCRWAYFARASSLLINFSFSRDKSCCSRRPTSRAWCNSEFSDLYRSSSSSSSSSSPLWSSSPSLFATLWLIFLKQQNFQYLFLLSYPGARGKRTRAHHGDENFRRTCTATVRSVCFTGVWQSRSRGIGISICMFLSEA